jgi:acetyl esterase/lipase
MATWIVSAIPNESPFLVFWWLRRRIAGRHAGPRAPEPGAVHVIERALDRPIAAKPPWARVVLAPLPVFHPGARRIGNLGYGDHGRRNRLDLYRRRGGGSGGPVLIHLHGGGFSYLPGRRSFYARLLFRLARQGWVCISATYGCSPPRPSPTS